MTSSHDRSRPPEGAGPPEAGGHPEPLQGVLLRIWRAVGDLFTNDVYVLASAIAFNALLSFFPFLLLLLSFARNVLGSREAYTATLEMTRDFIPTGQDFFIRNMEILVSSFGKGEVISIVLLLFTSSGILIPIQIALNRAWGVAHAPGDVTRQLIRDFRDQAVAFLIIVVCGLMALASTSLVALVQGLIADAFHSLRLVKLLSGMVIKILTLPLTVLIFFTLYFALPHRRIRARQAWSAAIFAAVLWELARMLFFWWVFPWLNFKETYGPFYVSVSLVMWAFVSSFVLLLGANLSAQDLLASRPGPEGRGGPDTPGPRAGEPADRGAGPFKRKDGI